jgi:glucose-6-phosphate 1-dehydrogenase
MATKLQVEQAGPLTLTIFGITGDLSSRMLLPALYDLALQKLLPSPIRIVGTTRRSCTVEELLGRVEKTYAKKGESVDREVLENLGRNIEIMTMGLDKPEEYEKLRQRLDKIEEEARVCMNRLFYMAVPPQLFGNVVERMGRGGLQNNCPHGTGESRLLVEKPFGHDLASAEELVDHLRKTFDEQQIYRIDHFLAKETAQNILTFRFQNSLFRAVWDKTCISQITVSATEKLDIEGRTNFYEQIGALRDMVQSHLLQMLALATMDVPAELTSDAVHDKKLELLSAIQPATPDQAVRGQYEGYKTEVNNPESRVETYAALKLAINNDHWQDVPIVLRTGKALAEKSTDITVVFTDHDDRTVDNTLTIRLAPGEGISLHLRAKKPGFEHVMQDVSMDFHYHNSFAGQRQPTAYERVLIDAFRGDRTLFATSHEVLTSWRILQPLLEAWAGSSEGLHEYQKGSLGPDAAQELVSGTK